MTADLIARLRDTEARDCCSQRTEAATALEAKERENAELTAKLAESEKQLAEAMKDANQCRLDLVGQIHELAEHVERAAYCVTDTDMLKQLNGQREYAIAVADKWNQNGNPFEARSAG